jgi:hypothetical protein
MLKDKIEHLSAVPRHVRVVAAALIALSAGIGTASPTLANAPGGPFAAFDQCPRFTEGVNFCVHVQTTGGVDKIGNGILAIVNPVTFQGGYERNEENETPTERFVGALNGETLSRTPQPIPGGLASLINCEEIKGPRFLIRAFRRACKAVLEDPSSTSISATTELVGQAGDIAIDSDNNINGEGIALSLPVKIHLENPLLGRDCYIGTDWNPIILNLTTGKTSPPPPNEPISGNVGDLGLVEFEGLNYGEVTDDTLVDNSFAAPAALGCGGPFAYAIDPIINSKLGLPSPAGNNTVIQISTSMLATAENVIKSEKNEPGEGPPNEKGHHRKVPPHLWH